MASVTFDHVYKRFGDVVAVNDLNIEVEDKEFLVFVGPSGCGKTTSFVYSPAWKRSATATS